MEDRNEWLQWRHKGIGSSDAPAIHGASPYQTAYELWETKIQPKYTEKEQNYVQRIGNEMEPIARTRFAALYNIENGTNESFAPRRIQMQELSFLLASLDGCSEDGKIIVEFKFQSKPGLAEKLTPGQQAHEDVRSSKVPRHYWIQVQHQLMVSGAKFAYFASFNGETLNVCKIEPDVEFMKDHLNKCIEFWQFVQSKKAPPLSAEDYKELHAKGAKGMIQKWKRLKVLIDDLEEQKESLKVDILALVDHPRMKCDGVRIVQYPGNAGGIDFAKIMNLPEIMALQIDVQKYRKPNGKPFWKMEAEK